MNKHKSNKIKENSNTVRHLIMQNQLKILLRSHKSGTLDNNTESVSIWWHHHEHWHVMRKTICSNSVVGFWPWELYFQPFRLLLRCSLSVTVAHTWLQSCVCVLTNIAYCCNNWIGVLRYGRPNWISLSQLEAVADVWRLWVRVGSNSTAVPEGGR